MRLNKGWLGDLVPYVALLGCLAVQQHDPIFLQNLRLKTFDALQQTWPREQTEWPVVVVDFDERSLSEIEQWPWPRNKIAQLVDTLFKHYQVRTVGFDIVFPEADGKSPEMAMRSWPVSSAVKMELLHLPKNDDILSDTVKKYPVVGGFALSLIPSLSSTPLKIRQPFSALGPAPDAWAVSVPGSVRHIAALEEAFRGYGHISFLPDPDNIIRRVPAVANVEGVVMPAFATELLRLSSPSEAQKQLMSRVERHSGDISLRAGIHDFPVDEQGAFLMYYRPHTDVNYISAADVLLKRAPKDALSDKIVLLGTSAAGLKDLRTTPMGPNIPGVDVHAQFIESVLQGAFLYRPMNAAVAELVFSLLAGVLLIVAVQKTGAMMAGVLASALIGTVVATSILLFALEEILVAPLFPALTLIFVFMAQNSVKYAREESERKSVRNAFGHYLSHDLINTLVQSPEKLTLGGEQKPLTMLFCDIRGFTTFSEKMTPQELTSFLNDYLTPMTDTLLRHNATIDKYMGDAIMAFWNAPLDIPDHTRHACTAALAMMARLNEMNSQWQKRGLPQVSIGVGIHTGFASVGNMGSAQRFDYTVIGDAVNLASRLEGLSKHYGVPIVVSAQVRNAVPDGILLLLDLVAVKGRNEPVEVFTLLGIGTPTERQRQLVNTAQAAHAAYRARQWDRATELFSQLEDFEVLRDDFLARIAEHQRLPPTDSWDGAYHATHK